MIPNGLIIGYMVMMLTIISIMIIGTAGFFRQWGHKVDTLAFVLCMLFGIVPSMLLTTFVIWNQ